MTNPVMHLISHELRFAHYYRCWCCHHSDHRSHIVYCLYQIYRFCSWTLISHYCYCLFHRLNSVHINTNRRLSTLLVIFSPLFLNALLCQLFCSIVLFASLTTQRYLSVYKKSNDMCCNYIYSYTIGIGYIEKFALALVTLFGFVSIRTKQLEPQKFSWKFHVNFRNVCTT